MSRSGYGKIKKNVVVVNLLVLKISREYNLLSM